MYPKYFVDGNNVKYKVEQPVCNFNSKLRVMTVYADFTAKKNGKFVSSFPSPHIQKMKYFEEEEAIRIFEMHFFYKLGRMIDSDEYDAC